jgi:hypothetical protein
MEIGMKLMTFILLTIVASDSAWAQTSCQAVGSQQICNGQNGASTTQHFGNQAVTNYSNGSSATTQSFGNQSVTNFSNGSSATTHQMGNQSVTTFNNGKSVVCQQIGTQTICN